MAEDKVQGAMLTDEIGSGKTPVTLKLVSQTIGTNFISAVNDESISTRDPYHRPAPSHCILAGRDTQVLPRGICKFNLRV